MRPHLPVRPALLTALLVVGGSSPLDAQEPDTVPEPRERPDTARQEPAAAPTAPAYVPQRFTLSLSVSTFDFNTLQSQPVLARDPLAAHAEGSSTPRDWWWPESRATALGTVMDSSTLSRTVAAEGGFQVGASGVLGLGPVWAVRLGAAVGRATLRPRYDGENALFEGAASRIARTEISDVTVLSAEAALRMRLPSARRARPFLEIGASAIHWQTGSPLPGAPRPGAGVRRFGGLAALGVDVPFSDRLAATAQATRRVFRTPLDTAPAGTGVASSSTVDLTFLSPPADLFADGARELSSGLRLELGITLGLGGAVTAPTDPAEPAGSPSPPGR